MFVPSLQLRSEMLEIDMTVKTESLDAHQDDIAKMLLFPPPLQIREVDINPGSIVFRFTMNGHTASSAIEYEHGSVQAIAKILDGMPFPTFLTGEAFLLMAAFMGGVVTGRIFMENGNHPDVIAAKAKAEKAKTTKKK